MPQLKFNHIFMSLLLLSAATAFFMPAAYVGFARGWADAIFAPVAYPLRETAKAIHGRFHPPDQPDVNVAPADMAIEIERLRKQVATLVGQVEELNRLNANRQFMGEAGRYAIPFRVIGCAGEVLQLDASSSDGLAKGMPVIDRDGLVGRITTDRPGGAHVLLISHPQSRVNALFVRFRSTSDGNAKFEQLKCPTPLVEGRGNGVLHIVNLTLQQTQDAGLVVGDWVVLHDNQWPDLVRWYYLGQVTHIQPQARSRQFAEITVTPRINLLQLSQVMVVTGKAAAPQAKTDGRPR